jgi:hypothetical protein
MVIEAEDASRKAVGNIQQALMRAISQQGKGQTQELSDIARGAEFRRVHFGRIQNAAKQLAKKGLIKYDGVSKVMMEGQVPYGYGSPNPLNSREMKDMLAKAAKGGLNLKPKEKTRLMWLLSQGANITPEQVAELHQLLRKGLQEQIRFSSERFVTEINKNLVREDDLKGKRVLSQHPMYDADGKKLLRPAKTKGTILKRIPSGMSVPDLLIKWDNGTETQEPADEVKPLWLHDVKEAGFPSDPNKHPLLRKLVQSGDIFVDKDEYVGKAADGEEVSLGSTHDPAQVERYLQSYPGPKDW